MGALRDVDDPRIADDLRDIFRAKCFVVRNHPYTDEEPTDCESLGEKMKWWLTKRCGEYIKGRWECRSRDGGSAIIQHTGGGKPLSLVESVPDGSEYSNQFWRVEYEQLPRKDELDLRNARAEAWRLYERGSKVECVESIATSDGWMTAKPGPCSATINLIDFYMRGDCVVVDEPYGKDSRTYKCTLSQTGFPLVRRTARITTTLAGVPRFINTELMKVEIVPVEPPKPPVSPSSM